MLNKYWFPEDWQEEVRKAEEAQRAVQEAAERLAEEYQENKELSEFTALDGDPTLDEMLDKVTDENKHQLIEE